MTRKLNASANCVKTIKILYSYGGRIVPRLTDGKLRYVGGYIRVLSVDRLISFAELMVKFGESCGFSVNLKCKLPSEDLDVLVSVKSEEDLRSVIEEYERSAPEAKIRAVLFPATSMKKVSPPSSPMSCFDFPSAPQKKSATATPAARYYAAPPCVAKHRRLSPAVRCPVTPRKYRCYEAGSPSHFYHVLHRNHTH